MSGARELLRAYLRQRRELGEVEVVLDRLTPAAFRSLLADAPAAAPAPPRAAPPPTGEPRRARPPAAGAASHPPAPTAPARGVPAEEIARLPTLDAVRGVALGCPRCGLAKTRRHVVFGEGPGDAEVLVVGEAPGQEEDESGRPFVGAEGKLLDRLLCSAGFRREDVYVCNVLQCRPPQNRNPEPAEVSACTPYLLRQVELVRPRLILAFGAFAAQALLGTDQGVGELRGREHRFREVPLVPTYPLATCLRDARWVRAVWEDLQRARGLLDAA